MAATGGPTVNPPMAANAKVAPLRKPGEGLRPELREFLDAAIIPALIKKYLAEQEGAESPAKKSLARLSVRP